MIDIPSIREEVKKITNKGLAPVSWTYTAHLIVDGVQVLTFRNVVLEKYSADYSGSVGPYHFIMVQLGAVTYRDFIVPNQGKMKILLRRTVLNRGDRSTVTELNKTYLGFLPEPVDLAKMAANQNLTNDKLDEFNLVTFPIQLVEEELFLLMNTDTSGVYRGRTDNMVANQLLRNLQDNQEVDVLKARNFSGLRGIETETFQNNTNYQNIIVEQGIKLKNLCKYIQNKYGISSFGVNTFFSNGLWYMFPLFKHDRYETERKTITVYNIPPSEMPSIDNSFSLRGDDLFILSTGDTKFIDESIRKEVNEGNGIRITPMSFYDNNHFSVTDNKVDVKGSSKAREFISKKSEHGIYNISTNGKTFDANPYPAISNLNSSQGGLMTVSWHNCDIGLLKPGMAARIFYEGKDGLASVDGTLLGINAICRTQNEQMAESEYFMSAELTFHIKEKR